MKEKQPHILIDSASPEERRSFLKKLGGAVAAATALGGFTNLLAKKTYSGTELSTYQSLEPFLGSICMAGFNFAPVNWQLCYGQLIAINQYTALFSLLGTQFGGNGQTNFALPDLRGRMPIGQGQGPGLTNRIFGQMSGSETAQQSVLNMPAHNHGATVIDPVYSGSGSVTPGAFSGRGGTASNDPINNFPAPAPTGTNIYNTTSTSSMGSSPVTVTVNKTTAGSVAIGNTGGSQPFSIMQPWTCVNFIIAMQGIYPSRQ